MFEAFVVTLKVQDEFQLSQVTKVSQCVILLGTTDQQQEITQTLHVESQEAVLLKAKEKVLHYTISVSIERSYKH